MATRPYNDANVISLFSSHENMLEYICGSKLDMMSSDVYTRELAT